MPGDNGSNSDDDDLLVKILVKFGAGAAGGIIATTITSIDLITDVVALVGAAETGGGSYVAKAAVKKLLKRLALGALGSGFGVLAKDGICESQKKKF
jgi:hypothetical protein